MAMVSHLFPDGQGHVGNGLGVVFDRLRSL
jgi:hypothetical protein